MASVHPFDGKMETCLVQHKLVVVGRCVCVFVCGEVCVCGGVLLFSKHRGHGANNFNPSVAIETAHVHLAHLSQFGPSGGPSKSEYPAFVDYPQSTETIANLTSCPMSIYALLN